MRPATQLKSPRLLSRPESQLGPDREIVSAMREHAAMRRHPRIFADIELLPVGIVHEMESCDRAFMPARATDAKKRIVRIRSVPAGSGNCVKRGSACMKRIADRDRKADRFCHVPDVRLGFLKSSS